MGEIRTALSPAVKPFESRRLDSLTGMRFYAALMVVVTHASHNFLPDGVRSFLAMGGVGVSFFFVLSGFVLVWSRKASQSRSDFYRNRFARVFPLHMLTWAIAGVLILMTTNNINLGVALATLVLLQSWVPIQSVFFGMNGPSWSLSCEAFFYAVFPFFAKRMTQVKASRLLKGMAWGYAGVGAVTLLLHVVLRDGPTVAILYVNPLYRLWEFALGMALACLLDAGWVKKVDLRLAALATMAAFVFVSLLNAALEQDAGLLKLLPMQGLPSDLASLVVVPFFMLLIYAAAASELQGRASHLHSRALIKLGAWSFALYLSHLLLIEAAKVFVPADMGLFPGVLLCLAVIAVAIPVSGLLYEYVERPLERRLRARAFASPNTMGS